MLGQVDRAAADFAPGRQALQQTQGEQHAGGPEPGLGIGRQQSHRQRGAAHQGDGDHEDLAPSDTITQRAKERGTERADDHASAKGGQASQQTCGGVLRRKEQRAEPDRQRRKGEKVVPLQKSAKAGGHGHAVVAVVRAGLGGCFGTGAVHNL